MGLGSLRSVPLALARELAAQAREQLARGLDPIAARKAAGLAEQAARARLMTFRECAEEYHAANLTRWRNAKHAAEWLSTLRRYAFPTLGHLSVDAIDSGLVQRVLAPLVASKPVTASRLRGRIETVLDYAKASRAAQRRQPRRQDHDPAHAADAFGKVRCRKSTEPASRQAARLDEGAARHAGQGGAAA